MNSNKRRKTKSQSHCFFEIEVFPSLHPHKSNRLSSMMIFKLLQLTNILLSLLFSTISNIRQKSNKTNSTMINTIIIIDCLGDHFSHWSWWFVHFKFFLRKREKIFFWPSPIIIFNFSSIEIFQCWISLYLIITTNWLIGCTVDSSESDQRRNFFCRLFKSRHHCFAVTAPRGIK